jgi:nucleotide-binding universal stress UspA family protein
MSEQGARQPLVVVGIDGSARTAPVLDWAVGHARAMRGRLRVVLAWRLPELPGYLPQRMEFDTSDAMEERMEKMLAEAFAAHDIRPGELEVERVVQEGGAVRLLLQHSHGADMLVLGSDGEGHDARKLVGSVTHSCLTQATCPLVVIPLGDRG